MLTTIIISTYIALQISLVTSSNIFWKNVTLSTAVLYRPEPAGLIDGQHHVYVCKVYADNRWISGRLDFTQNAVSSCRVAIYGEEHHGCHFQILISPPGTTSWVPFTGKLPANAIAGGSHRDGTPGYVCRAPYENSLTLGISHASGNQCYMTLGGREVQAQPADKIEILVRNNYGMFYDEHYGHSTRK